MNVDQLRKRYDLTLRLQSQLLSVIYDMETFGGRVERIADEHSDGENENSVVTLRIAEPLPSMKRLTEAVEEHWKAMLHAAIAEAARQSGMTPKRVRRLLKELYRVYFQLYPNEA